MKRRLTKILTLLCVSTMILSGCGGSDSSSKGVDENHVFQVILNAAPTGFSPLKTNDSTSTNITAQIYETLYRRSYDGGAIIPGLAAELPTFSEDGLTATIKLREGVKFQDETDFNSEAVKYVLEKIKDPNSGSLRPSIASSISSIECPDATTVILHLEYPDGVLTAKLAHTNAAIFSPTADQKQDLMTQPVGTGPYKLSSYVSGSEVVLTRNEEYWGEKPEIKEAKFTVVAETSTALSRLETGEADLMPSVPVTQISRAKQLNGVTFKSEESAKTTYLAFRTSTAAHPEIMNDLEARKAIAMAIDSEGYLKTIEGNGSHSNSLVGPKLIGYDAKGEKDGYSYNVEEAKKIVQAKGLENKEIVLLCSNTTASKTLGEYIQANLKSAGFNNVKLDAVEYSSYLSDSKVEGRYDICLFSWSNVTGDATEFLEPNFVTANRVQWQSPELVKLVDEGKKTLDLSVRTEKIMEANKLLVDNVIATPIYNDNMCYAYSSKYEVKQDMGQQFYLADIAKK